MTFVDTALEKFYLFAKLLLKQLPYQKQTLPLQVVAMIDRDKYLLLTQGTEKPISPSCFCKRGRGG